RAARLELHAHAAPALERVPEHDLLGLRVERGALELAPEPRPADLDALVLGHDAAESGRAGHAPARTMDRDERNRAAALPLLERLLEIPAQVGFVAHERAGEAPELGLEPHRAQPVPVAGEVERLEPHEAALQRGGEDVHARMEHSRGRNRQRAARLDRSAPAFPW